MSKQSQMSENDRNNSTERICPKCGKAYSDPPALSRKDNKTQICPECGTREAMNDAGIDKEEQEKIIEEIKKATAGK